MLLKLLLIGVLLSVLFGWLGLGALTLVLVNRRVAALDGASPGRTGLYWGCVPTAYALSMGFFPLPFVVGAWMLRGPELARQGRVTIVWGFALGTLYLGLGFASLLLR